MYSLFYTISAIFNPGNYNIKMNSCANESVARQKSREQRNRFR